MQGLKAEGWKGLPGSGVFFSGLRGPARLLSQVGLFRLDRARAYSTLLLA